MLPIFTRILSASGYGIDSLYCTWVAFFSMIISIGVIGTIGSAKINLSNEEYEEYLTNTMLIGTCNFVLILILSLIFIDKLSYVIGLEGNLIIPMIIQSFFMFVINFTLAKISFDNNPKYYLVISLISTLLNIILSISLILSFNEYKYLGKIYGGAISTIIIGVCLYRRFIKFKYINKFWVYFKFSIKLGIPLLLHNISTLILNQADRIMLQNFIGDYWVGIYSFNYNMGIILNVINMSINNAWVVWYFKALKEKRDKEINEKSKIYIVLFTFITSLVILTSKESVMILADKRYWDGVGILPIIILGYYFVFLYTFSINYEFYKKNTNYIAIGGVIASIINILLNYVLIPIMGIYGAAISTLFAYIILFIIHEFIVRKVFKHSDFEVKYFVYSILFISFIILVNYFFISHFIIRIIIILIIIISMYIYIIRIRKRKDG